MDEKAFLAKSNPLALAGALGEDETGEVAKSQVMDVGESKVKSPIMLGTDNIQVLERIDASEFSQKAHLLHALLAIGCIGPAIHLLSLHPYISGPYPSISDGIHRLLHVAIDPIYAPHSPARSFGEDVLAASNARKRRAVVNRSAPAHLNGFKRLNSKLFAATTLSQSRNSAIVECDFSLKMSCGKMRFPSARL